MAETKQRKEEQDEPSEDQEREGPETESEQLAAIKVQRDVLNLMKLVVYVLCLVMLIHAFFASIGIHEGKIDLDVESTAILAPTIALFAVLVTGVFIFATFQIDQKAMAAARQVAEKTVKKTVESAVQEAVSHVRGAAEEAKTLVSKAEKRSEASEAHRAETKRVLKAVMAEAAKEISPKPEELAKKLIAKIEAEYEQSAGR